MPPNSYNALTHRQKNICEYGGVFGVLLSLTCLIQHITVTRVTDITKIMMPGYIFAIVSFALLGFQKTYAVILLIISGVYSAFIEYQWISHKAV
jgi:hypothetical protein